MKVSELLEQLKQHEREHKCKVHSAQIQNGEIVSIQCVPFPSVNNYVINVWNCRADLARERGDGSLEFIEIPEEHEEQVDDILRDCIYEQGGAINWSGIYPLTEEYYQKLNKILNL